MITFKHLRTLVEAKQVGTIYHFTTFDSLHHLAHQDDPFTLSSHNKTTISTTRNPQLPVHNKHFGGCGVRIALDGDKISEHHKIRPVAGMAYDQPDVFDIKNQNRIKRSSGEAEEAIVKHPLNLRKYIKHIHVTPKSKEEDDHYHNVIGPKLDSLGIKHSSGRSIMRESTYEDPYYLTCGANWSENFVVEFIF